MSGVCNVFFEEKPTDIKERVTDYWTKRADSFFDIRYRELKSNKAERWLYEIEALIPHSKRMNILDIGCGAGFFEVILGKRGHYVTGIDLTMDMVDRTSRMIQLFGVDENNVRAFPMDAEMLAFPDNTFDVVISRNLTWTLPRPVSAYQEWSRVLKAGGILLNFDAAYAQNAHRWLKSPENLAHRDIPDKLKDECLGIYDSLTISSLDRPEWDAEVLGQVGFSRIEADIDFGARIFKERDEFYIPDCMFRIAAFKD